MNILKDPAILLLSYTTQIQSCRISKQANLFSVKKQVVVVTGAGSGKLQHTHKHEYEWQY